jgi:lipid-A-disaccharide synthase
VVLVLPGSRASEIRRLIVVFGEALGRLSVQAGPVEAVLPTLPHLLPAVTEAVRTWPLQPRVVLDTAEKNRAFRTARVALAASGTVTLELAVAGVPTVAAYRVPLWEGLLFRLLAHVDTAILANLVLGENIVPEFHQLDCRGDLIGGALIRLMGQTAERQRQIDAFGRLETIMGLGTLKPALRAAEIVHTVALTGRRGGHAPDGRRES